MISIIIYLKMSKGGHGAAAANILLLKKSEESRRQENAIRDAIKVSFELRKFKEYSS